MSLIPPFQQIRDYRTQPVYPLWVSLVQGVMKTMSGCHGDRPLAAFISRHQPVLLELMEQPNSRLPSLSTLRRIMVRLDFNQLSDVFNAWAMEHCGNDFKGQLATDSKSIKASLSDSDKSYQDFCQLGITVRRCTMGKMTIRSRVIDCPHCHSRYVVKNGRRNRKQSDLCRDCHRQFREDPHPQSCPPEVTALCVKMYLNGIGF